MKVNSLRDGMVLYFSGLNLSHKPIRTRPISTVSISWQPIITRPIRTSQLGDLHTTLCRYSIAYVCSRFVLKFVFTECWNIPPGFFLIAVSSVSNYMSRFSSRFPYRSSQAYAYVFHAIKYLLHRKTTTTTNVYYGPWEQEIFIGE